LPYGGKYIHKNDIVYKKIGPRTKIPAAPPVLPRHIRTPAAETFLQPPNTPSTAGPFLHADIPSTAK